MSATAVDTVLKKTVGFYQASIGKKAVMAVTAGMLFGCATGRARVKLGGLIVSRIHDSVSSRTPCSGSTKEYIKHAADHS